SGRRTWWSVRAQPARSKAPLRRSSRVMSPSAKVTFGNSAARSRPCSSNAGSRSTASTSATCGASANASAPVPAPASSARSSPRGWTKRRTCSVSSARRASSSSAIRSAVSDQRSPDKLQRLLSGRDRSRGSLLGDQLEEPADLGPRRDPELVAAEQRLRRLSRAGLANRAGELVCAEEGERLERPRLRRAAEPVDLPRRPVARRGRAQERVREAAQLVRDRQPAQTLAERGGKPEPRRVERAQARRERRAERLEQPELVEPLVPGGREAAKLVEYAFPGRSHDERRVLAHEPLGAGIKAESELVLEPHRPQQP